MGAPRGTRSERFWRKVDTNGPSAHVRGSGYEVGVGQCWLWTSPPTKKGYGQFTIDDHTKVFAHRFAYEELVGPIPEGLDIDHLCRTRLCVNPAHMEPVTRKENLLRGETAPARRAQQTHCHHGHAFDAENTRITTRGQRRCRRCERADKRRRYADAKKAGEDA